MDVEKKISEKIRFGTCTKDCYGSCVFLGEWSDNAPEYKLISAVPLKDHPFTQGFFCQKLNRRQDLIYHPKRLKKPLIRTEPKGKNSFNSIHLEEALNIVAEILKDIKKKYGSTAILAAYFAGNSGLLSMYAPLRFFGKLGATVTSGGICNEGGCAGLSKLFGTYSTTNPFQLINKNARLIVVWGSNLSETNIHAYLLVKKALRDNAILAVVDSRRTRIAEDAHIFLQPYPGTEHLLSKLILYQLITQDAYDESFLKEYVDGYNSIISEAIQVDEKKILSQIGVDSQTLHDFINLLIELKHHTIFNIGYGVQKDFYGGRIVKAITLIQILLGNFGKPGTGLIYSQSDFNKAFLRPLLDYITKITPESLIKKIPIIKLGSALDSGDYKMLFIYNFNPASSLPNQNQVRKALSQDDIFVVMQDQFLNETTKYADIVIPAKFDVESHDLVSPYYIPGLSINQAGPCPYPDCMSNYEFFQKLAYKIGWENSPTFQETDELILQGCLNLLPIKIREDIRIKGYHILFEKNYVPFKNLNFPTPNGRIQAHGPHFEFGKQELERRLNRNKNEFLLITPSHVYFLHSQLGQIHPRYLEVFHKIFLNQDDINALNLKVGNEVKVSNEYGSSKYIISESKVVKPGVALIFSGTPFPFSGNSNANLFTPDRPEELGLSGAYNSALIKIYKIISNNK